MGIMVTMKHTALFLSVLSLSLTGGVSASQADYFVWQDGETGVSLSYPDTWRQATNVAPDDVLTLFAPNDNGGEPQCRVRARDDKRFEFYPVQYSAEAGTVGYGREFWDSYLASYDRVMVHDFKEETGLGRGFGSSVIASYKTTHPVEGQQRSSLLASGLYNGTAYIVDCSADTIVFNEWYPQFTSFLKSVDTKKVTHELIQGENPDMSGNHTVGFKDKTERYRFNQ
jgi:hypothetical protein